MKKLTVAVLLISLLAGCTSSTEFGPCIGAFDDKNPKLVYRVSAWNLVVGIMTFSLIAPPVFVIVEQTFCPVGIKGETK